VFSCGWTTMPQPPRAVLCDEWVTDAETSFALREHPDNASHLRYEQGPCVGTLRKQDGAWVGPVVGPIGYLGFLSLSAGGRSGDWGMRCTLVLEDKTVERLAHPVGQPPPAVGGPADCDSALATGLRSDPVGPGDDQACAAAGAYAGDNEAPGGLVRADWPSASDSAAPAEPANAAPKANPTAKAAPKAVPKAGLAAKAAPKAGLTAKATPKAGLAAKATPKAGLTAKMGPQKNELAPTEADPCGPAAAAPPRDSIWETVQFFGTGVLLGAVWSSVSLATGAREDPREPSPHSESESNALATPRKRPGPSSGRPAGDGDGIWGRALRARSLAAGLVPRFVKRAWDAWLMDFIDEYCWRFKAQFTGAAYKNAVSDEPKMSKSAKKRERAKNKGKKR